MQYSLEVSPTGGWSTSWRAPLIAVVIVVSFLFSAVVLVALMYMRQHQTLLYALMPKRLVKGKVRTFPS